MNGRVVLGLLGLVASNHLTVAAFIMLGVVIATSQLMSVAPSWLIAVPLALLALNLAAALAAHARLRRGGLAVFHFSLLGCLLLVAWGRLSHYEGRIELVQGGAFDASSAESLSRGPWHGDRLSRVRFEQGAFSVDYAPGVKRSHTRSQVEVLDADGVRRETVGDDRPLRIDGFRFYTTHNKGYAPLLTWAAQDAAPVTGAVHLPSYPLNDWQQQHSWSPPGVPQVRFWLRLATPVDEQKSWRLQPDQTQATLVVEMGGKRFELQPGDSAVGDFGTLRYDRLLGWMGYRIHYDPTLTPLFWLSCFGVAGLALHLWPLPARRRLPQQQVQGHEALS